MNKSTLTALEGSINKWEDIALNNGIDEGFTNCPLCSEFLIKHHCKGCPIFQQTGRTSCTSTPYEEWWHHQYTCHSREGVKHVYCMVCTSIAIKEVDFLKSLLPKPEQDDKLEALNKQTDRLVDKAIDLLELANELSDLAHLYLRNKK